MTAIELYKFIEHNQLEWHYTHEDKDVILFVDIHCISEFNNMLGTHILDEEGIQCNMKEGYFCFCMDDITAHFAIELKDVFDKSEEQ